MRFSSLKTVFFTAVATLFLSGPVLAQTKGRPLTKEQQTAAGQAGATFGRDRHYDESHKKPEYQEGGENNGGRVKVGNEFVDTNKLIPGADGTKVDSLKDIHENGQDFTKLKEKTAARDAEMANDDGPAGQAHRVGETSAIRTKDEETKLTADKEFWNRNLNIKEGAEAGVIPGGGPAPSCKTTTTTTTKPGYAYIEEEKTCERIPDPSKTPLCTREVVTVGGTTTYDQEKRALLAFDNGTSGQICRRERNVTSHRDLLSQSKAGDLEITQETSGLSCQRFRGATEVVTTQNKSKDGTLAINTEMGGLSCKRDRWVDAVNNVSYGSRTAQLGMDTQTGGLSCTRYIQVSSSSGTQGGSMDTVLSINGEMGGLVCNRSRAATSNTTVTGTGTVSVGPYQSMMQTEPSNIIEEVSIANLLPAGTTSITNLTDTLVSSSAYVDFDGIVEQPTAANGWVIKYSVRFAPCDDPDPIRCVKYGGRMRVRFDWNNVAGTSTWSVIENGNCATPGTDSCPLQWSCLTEAPNTVNGSYMTVADVSGLAALYPGSSPTCLSGNLSKVCSGSANTSNAVSIAHLIPAGTSSINNFRLLVQNPQGGVYVFVVQAPTLANGWVAVLGVNRTVFSYQPTNPQVTMLWDAPVTSLSHNIVETGNCGDPGSLPYCPTQWGCSVYAPGTVNGQTVTTDIAAARAPLFPGAPNTCASATLSRVCAGDAGTSTSVSIADLIPPGVSAIQNFAWTVSNPQSGVTVSLAAAPSQANGWVAQFTVNKTNWSTTTYPSVNMTWIVNQTSYNWSVKDTGGSIAQLIRFPAMIGGSAISLTGMSSISALAGSEASAMMATDCSDTGSSVCPTSWSCNVNAPTTINGVSVSAGMVSGLGQLFPGAATTCTSAQLSRVCSGASSLGTSISISDQVPVGATTIRDLAFTVLNPQSGVTVQMTSPPTYANGWMAGFTVTRSNYSYQPQPVQVRITFTADARSIAMSVSETGNCSDPGSTACPTRWNCTANAPTVINGLNISAAMVQNEPVLYPGASNLCVAGDLKRVCDGTSAISSQISIGELLPSDATSITNFAWNVTNPQAAITVSLQSAPTLANGWVATFNVTRNYAGGGAPVKPNIMMTWNVLSALQYDHSVITQGDCSGAADGAVSTSCSVRWRCNQRLPKAYGDIFLTRDMLLGRDDLRLYPGEDLDCADAIRERSCVADGANLTVVDISDKIPANVTVLKNYGWDVSTASPGVKVEQVEAPTLANGWKATFKTTRTDWSVTPNQPEVRLHWQVDVSTTTTQIVDTGDCSAQGDAFCKADWRCVEEFPTTNSGIVISKGSMDVAFGPPTVSGGMEHSFSLSANMPGGTLSIQNFQMLVVNLNAFSNVVGITQTPSASNGWMVKVKDSGECHEAVYSDCLKYNGGQTKLRFTWDNMSGAGATQTQEPPIFSGATNTCKRAERFLNCAPINNGEVCHETEAGTVCDTVEGGPFNNCKALSEDASCTKKKTFCNEDGWGGTPDHPICRIETDLYVCKEKVGGDDVVVKETTQCTGEMSACLDGSCVAPVESEEETDSATMRKAAANLAIRENMRSDYQPTGYVPIAKATRKASESRYAAVASAVTDKLLGGFISEANAQVFDPWKMPSGANVSGAIGSIGNYNADTLRFFDGKPYNCMKALGGLLNCCTKNIDKKGTNTEWWSSFGDILKKKYSESMSCNVSKASTEEKESGSNAMQNGATQESFMKAFTGATDQLKGGGTMPTPNCGAPPKMEDVMKDFMGTMKKKYFPKLAWYCDTDEKELAAQKEVGNCSYLGDYCKTKVLGFCLDKRQRHCCFNSPMTKMIREMLRDKGIKGMGTAKNPDCSGVTPAQFAAMNPEEMDTGDLEGRMLLGGAIPDMSSFLTGSGLLEQFTGTGSSINSDRVNAHTRTNAQLAGTNPSGANDSMSSVLKASTPTSTTPTGSSTGNISFKSGYRSTSGPTNGNTNRIFKVYFIRTGGAGSVSAQVVPVSGTALAGTDFTFSATSVSWGNGDKAEKSVDVTILKNVSRTSAKTFELRLQSPAGGAQISPTATMQVTINP